ncbi:uncharacterized protein K02A2.6-like [Toxorhynchites rutilus septentrionalis]|uniref:uncharacterized protein K02A2.6-like n=1 Tax=Toxorhynchites rutilus septentrionalis TaxID=329112 RepID=UPI002478EC50|nr:uncharacterized protein K02A2.6-like [Toxorhynchites rutilus septentrionalis]
MIDPPYYDVAIQKLDEHFEPMRRRNYERHLFRQIIQKQEERFADYVLRLLIQAKRCEFDRYDTREVEDRIIEQVVETCQSNELRRQILAKDLALEEIVALGTTLADVQQQMKELDRTHHEIKPSEIVNKISKQQFAGRRRPYSMSTNTYNRACFACDRKGHLKGDSICRARNAKCLKCGETGHFINRCLKRTHRFESEAAKPKCIRQIAETVENRGELQTDEKIFYAMGKNVFNFVVGGIKIPMVIDSGADANVIEESTWNRARVAGIKFTEMSQEIDRKLVAYASEHPMKIKFMFCANVEAGSNSVNAKFYVVERGQQNLLGDSTAKALKVLKVGFDVGAVNASDWKIFPKIKGIVLEIPIDRSVQPIQQAYRRAPIALEERIHNKLKYLLEMDIIEKVNGPSPWVSPVVPVLKQSGDIRLCVDMRRANQAVLRETHPLPVVEELIADVEGAVKFSKLDVKDAYHQLELSEESRVITTFITKYGLFGYKRLMFGISCAPELFQKVMDTIVAGLDGVMVYLDDVIVFGRTQEEHDGRLRKLLQRFEEYGVVLNKDKCQFNVEKLELLGHELSSEGVKPTECRVQAVNQFRRPNNITELRSFLGLVTYVGRFIPHLASKTDSLRALLRSECKFVWTEEHQKAFDEIKKAVCDIKKLGFFNVKDKTILVADASPTGLGAVLLQEDVQGQKQIIAYASKSLTNLERKYFQTEKEALALVWAVDRFKLYLQGAKFALVTDCKPLKFLFGPNSKPCARIERWVLRLQSYSYDVVYQPGSTNLADVLSRLSVTNSETYDPENESYIQMLATFSAPVAITVQEIQEETKKDEEIQKVITSLEAGTWSEEVKSYKAYATELCTTSNVLFRGDRIVVPTSLRSRIMEIAHEGHPGVVVMKSRLRQKVWWPGMDAGTERFVRSSKDCTIVSSVAAPEPLIRTKIPDKPWVHIAVDFMGPLPSGHNLLVLIDYFSRFIEVIIMKEISARNTILALHETFCRYGIPESIKSDNGPQFISEPLQNFCKEFGIELRKTTPYWPQANGEVECDNRSLKKRLQISQESTKMDWK